MKRDLKHCVVCSNPHMWSEQMFMSGIDWERQIHAIACPECKLKIEAKQIPHNRIQDHVFEAVRILEGKS